MDLSSKTILVTGATGFIGGHLAARLLKIQTVEVRCLVRSADGARHLEQRGAHLVEGDLNDKQAVDDAVRGADVVFHAAGWVGSGRDRAEAWRVNVEGTRTLIEAAVRHRVGRFVHVSSCTVYGSVQALGIDELVPAHMSGTAYSDSKVASEAVVVAAMREHGLPAVLARPSQVYGLDSPQYTLRPIRALKSRTLFLLDGGRHYCKPIYIENLVDALIRCAEVDEAVGEAINLTDDAPVPWSVFLGAYARMAGVRRLRSVPFPLAWLAALGLEIVAAARGRSAPMSRAALSTLRSVNSFSNRKAKRILGWKPRVDLSEGMRRTEAWLRSEGHLPFSFTPDSTS